VPVKLHATRGLRACSHGACHCNSNTPLARTSPQASGDGWGVSLAAKHAASGAATPEQAPVPKHATSDPEAQEIKRLKQALRAHNEQQEIQKLQQELKVAQKAVATGKLASKTGSLADKEASIFDGKSWCSGCAPTYPLANVVSSNAQRVASNSDNMMAIYRKTNAGLAHVNKELGALVGMQRQVDLAPAEDTSPYASPYTSAGPYTTPYASAAYGAARPVGYRSPSAPPS